MSQMKLKLKNDNLNIVYLGVSTFPYGMAATQRIKLIAKGLIEAGAKVLILTVRGCFSRESDWSKIPVKGTFEGIDYFYTSGITYTPTNFFRRNLLELLGLIKEARILYKKSQKGEIDAAIIYTQSLFTVIRYFIYSRAFSFKILLEYVEYESKKKQKNLRSKVNSLLFDKLAFLFVDAVLPISEFLIKHIKYISPTKPYLKVPIVVDLQRFKKVKMRKTEKYFLFCGALGYLEVIEFILKAYAISHAKCDAKLYLIVNGSKQEFDTLNSDIKELNLTTRIEIYSNLSDERVAQLYRNALGLLIPLRPTLQDKARFPHKIGEYLASGHPIITTNWGEIRYYFVNKENAFISNQYDIKQYAKQLDFVTNNETFAEKVGIEGRKTAEKYFNYKDHGEKLYKFIEGLIEER